MPQVGEHVGDYEIEAEVGAGAMARVYRVRHVFLETTHALKILEPTYRANPEARRRFLDEAKIQAKHLDHPNILKVTNIVATAEVAALVMEFIDGPSLESHLPAVRGHTDEIRALMRQILDGVGHAHRAGIIHRDLKPANILLDRRPDGRLVPKVTDFGIAKVTDAAAVRGAKKSTHADARMGTLAYMSPEQIRRAKEVTPRSDIFSLGAVLYELVTGTVPFDGESDFDIMEQIVNGRFEPPERRAPRVEPAIAATIKRALQTSPDARFASCAEMAAALDGAGAPSVTAPAVAAPAVAAPAAAAAAAAAPVRTLVRAVAPPPAAAPAPARPAHAASASAATAPAAADPPVAASRSPVAASRSPVARPAAATAPGTRPSRRGWLLGGLVVGALGLGALAAVVGGVVPGAGEGGGPTLDGAPAGGAGVVTAAQEDAAPVAGLVGTPSPSAEPPPDAAPPDGAQSRLAYLLERAPDAGTVVVPLFPDPPAAPSCRGAWASGSELTLSITGSAGSCGSYTFRDGENRCAGRLTGCSAEGASLRGHISCSYTQTDVPLAGTIHLTCEGARATARTRLNGSAVTWSLKAR